LQQLRGGIRRKISTQAWTGGEILKGQPVPPTPNVNGSPDLGSRMGTILLFGKTRGQDTTINVALAGGLADIAPRHKSERSWGVTQKNNELAPKTHW